MKKDGKVRDVNHNIRWTPQEDAEIRAAALANGFDPARRELSGFYRFLWNRAKSSDLAAPPHPRRTLKVKGQR